MALACAAGAKEEKKVFTRVKKTSCAEKVRHEGRKGWEEKKKGENRNTKTRGERRYKTKIPGPVKLRKARGRREEGGLANLTSLEKSTWGGKRDCQQLHWAFR